MLLLGLAAKAHYGVCVALVWLLSRSGKLEGILSDYSLWTPLGGGEGGPGCPLVAAVAGRWSVSLEATLSLIKLYLLDHSFLINKVKRSRYGAAQLESQHSRGGGRKSRNSRKPA